MKILIYGLNFYPELTGIGKYTGEMAHWLSSNGHAVKVITAPPYYPEWKIHNGYGGSFYKKDFHDNIEIIRCPLFIPKQLNTKKRILHLVSFSFTSFFALILQINWRPDLIINIVPTLFCTPGTIFFSKLARSKTILHIQDFEVDAMLGLGMANPKFFAKLALTYEKWCLKRFNHISTISNSMIEKAIDKGVDPKKLILFPNWAEVERFQNVTLEESQILRAHFNVSLETKIILYSGNVGDKQGLEIVIEAAEFYKNNNYKFLIVGHGSGRNSLEKLVMSRQLTNVEFLPLQPYSLLPALLKMADCHLVVQKKGAADAVMPSKLTNILAAGGNAVITADKGTELGQICERFPGIAIRVEPESPQALIDGIYEALNMPVFNAIAQNYALSFLKKENILEKFIHDIFSIKEN